MRYLRQLIRETLLQERAATPQMASQKNLALAVYTEGRSERSYVLFDRNQFVHFLIQEMRSWVKDYHFKLTVSDILKKLGGNYGYSSAFAAGMADHASEFIVGTIEIVKPRLSTTRSNGAWEVHGPAASENYGPMMYDIAMSDVGELMPDRLAVSPSAAKVWRYYKDKRSDVVSTPLDNIDDPLTPPKSDDAHLYNTDPEDFGNYLDSSYHLSGQGPDVESLKASYQQLEGYLEKHLKMNPGITRQILKRAMGSFFNKKDAAQYQR